MEWLLDLTADELRERSSKKLDDFLTTEHENACRQNFNKLLNQASENGRTYIYMTGYSPRRDFIPLFGEGVSKDMPLMTQKLKEHLISKGFSVTEVQPPFAPMECVRAAWDNGDYYGSVTISWEKSASVVTNP